MTPPEPMRLPGSDRGGLARRRLLALAALAPTAAVMLGACSSASGKQLTSKATHETISPSEVASEVAKAATACDQLGGKLLTHYLKADSTTTAMASPLSLALVLAILADGATDATTQGYDALLGLSGEDRDRAWSAIQSSLNRYDGELKGFDPDKVPDKPLAHLANHVLIADEKDIKVKQTYLDTVLRWFSAEIEQIEVDSMKKNLDAWASRNTAGLIPNSGITITKDTRLVVQNALLFAASWDSPFKAEDTSQEDFTLAGGKTVKADLMHDTRSIPYATGKGWAAVRLHYAGEEENSDGSQLALDVVLPDAGTLPGAMNAGTWAAASKALDSAKTREVTLALPKLDLTSQPKERLDFPDRTQAQAGTGSPAGAPHPGRGGDGRRSPERGRGGGHGGAGAGQPGRVHGESPLRAAAAGPDQRHRPRGGSRHGSHRQDHRRLGLTAIRRLQTESSGW